MTNFFLHLMHMWRTGALMVGITADEDEDFDMCSSIMHACM